MREKGFCRDDVFLLFADSRAKAEKALKFAGRALRRLGLDLHPDKTTIVLSSPAVRFLGERLPRRQ